MNVLVWTVALGLAAQSLGEVAEREKRRRARNAEAGVEAVSYTGSGHGVELTSKPQTPEDEAEAQSASPLEEEHERGKDFEPRMEAIARAADGVDQLYQRYLDRCHNRYAIGETPPGIGVPIGPSQPVHVEAGRNWFVVLEAPSSSSAAVPRVGSRNIVLVQTVACQELWRDIVDAANEVKRSMRALLVDARREGILPGVIRELRRKYRLEWSGWER